MCQEQPPLLHWFVSVRMRPPPPSGTAIVNDQNSHQRLEQAKTSWCRQWTTFTNIVSMPNRQNWSKLPSVCWIPQEFSLKSHCTTTDLNATKVVHRHHNSPSGYCWTFTVDCSFQTWSRSTIHFRGTVAVNLTSVAAAVAIAAMVTQLKLYLLLLLLQSAVDDSWWSITINQWQHITTSATTTTAPTSNLLQGISRGARLRLWLSAFTTAYDFDRLC